MSCMYICDPVCVLPFGHNAPAMSYFRSFFRPAFERVECCVGRPFSAAAASEHDFRPYFTYLYSDIMPLETEAPVSAVHTGGGTWPNDAASRIARADYESLIRQERLGPADLLFLPSADFHSIHGVIAALRAMPPAESPRVLMRLIGVMENAGHVVVDPLQHVCTAIKACAEAGYRILLAAETPGYTSHLATSFDIDVALLPYPLLADALPLPTGERFVVASAGSARFDKGFLDLLAIIREVHRHSDDIAVEFRIQLLPDRHIVQQQSYVNQLYAAPGVELLPAILSSDDMRDVYAGCHAVLLPYDQQVYRLRGSAVLMEAIAYGRYAVAGSDLGFASQIQYYQNGATCNTLEQFAAAILAVARRPAEHLRRQLSLARTRYGDDTAAAYRTWMERCFV